jgi:hypothetical protein
MNIKELHLGKELVAELQTRMHTRYVTEYGFGGPVGVEPDSEGK